MRRNQKKVKEIVRVAWCSLMVFSAILALSGSAMSQTVTTEYKDIQWTKAGRARWADGKVGGGYVRPDPNYKVALGPDGHPDIHGMWQAETLGAQAEGSLEAISGDPKVTTRIVDPTDGKIPYKSWARPKVTQLDTNYIDPQSACAPDGLPRLMAYRNYEILEVPGEIAVVTEHSENFRHIYMDGRPHIGSNLKLYAGDSRGHWDGNTLVIDGTNLNDKTWLSIRGDFHSDQLHVSERLTPVAQDVMQYEVTIDDPVVFEKPWTMAFPIFRERDQKYEMWEEYCDEGNKSTDMQISAGRKLYSGIENLK